MIAQLCHCHEAEDKDYKLFCDKVAPAILPETYSAQKAELKTKRWTTLVIPEMEAFCVIVLMNYRNRWINGESACRWLDGKDSKSKAKCK
jgi:hypothetical protein